MKKNFFALALAATSCLSAGAYAGDGASGTITFNGLVNSSTCVAPTDFASAKVELGTVGLNEITSPFRPWSKDFLFTHCPASLTKLTTTVTFTESGWGNPHYGFVRNTGTVGDTVVMSLGHDATPPNTTGYAVVRTGAKWDTNIVNGEGTVNLKGIQFKGLGTASTGTLSFPVNLTVEYI